MNRYANYGKGRELRTLVDQLEDTQYTLIKAQESSALALTELERCTRVVSALAEQYRRDGRRKV